MKKLISQFVLLLSFGMTIAPSVHAEQLKSLRGNEAVKGSDQQSEKAQHGADLARLAGSPPSRKQPWAKSRKPAQAAQSVPPNCNSASRA